MDLKPFAIERFFAAHEFSARINLSGSDCEPLSLAEVLELADEEVKTRWREMRLGYTESLGLPLLREEISRIYRGLRMDEVLEVVPEEGIFLAMTALLEAGDRVVAMRPAYQSLYEIARAKGCALSFWEPEETPQGWRFDVARLAPLLATRPRLVVVNFPHNPTGALLSSEELSQVAEMVRKAGAWLFSDEIYRGLEHEGGTTLPSAVELYDRSVVLGGLSKAFGAPGLRVGWLALKDRDLLSRITTLKDYTTICASAPSELLALAILRARAKVVERSLARVKESLSALRGFLSAVPGLFSLAPPKAGSVALVRLDGEPSAERFCERLLKDTGILLLPSTRFEYGDHHLRFGLGRASFAQGLEEIRRSYQLAGRSLG